MKRLSEAVHVFQEACVRYDDLKEAFRDPAKAGVEFLKAREAYFACQPAYETACQELSELARTLHKRGRLISEYENLSTGLRMVMLRALRETGLEDLLDTRRKIRSFSELVQAWYLAKMVADVASQMRDARLRYDDQTFEEAVTQSSKGDRGEAVEILIANYEDTLGSFGDSDQNSWDAVRIVNDEARHNFETLSNETCGGLCVLISNNTRPNRSRKRNPAGRTIQLLMSILSRDRHHDRQPVTSTACFSPVANAGGTCLQAFVFWKILLLYIVII
jgi:hypothetical protein